MGHGKKITSAEAEGRFVRGDHYVKGWGSDEEPRESESLLDCSSTSHRQFFRKQSCQAQCTSKSTKWGAQLDSKKAAADMKRKTEGMEEFREFLLAGENN